MSKGRGTKGCVLVTGAGGYIGSVLVEELLDHGYEVRALDRFFFGAGVLAAHAVNPRLKLLRTDVRDVTPVDFEGVDAVCDLAALSNDPAGDLDPGLTRAVNHEGRARVARAAKEAGVGRYVLASSCSVYGDGAGAPGACVESGPTNPLTVYAEANLDAEASVRALADDDFCVTMMRNATVFGASQRMRFDLVVNLMTLHAFEKARVTVMGGGRQWRPLVHVRDAASAMLAVLQAPVEKVCDEAFNVGHDNVQVLTVAMLVRETLPFAVEIIMAPDDPDRRDYKVDFSKLTREVGFTPSTTIEDGIFEIYNSLKYGRLENSPQCSTVGWYRNILAAKKLLEDVELNGRVL